MTMQPIVQEYLRSFSEAWSKKGFFIALTDALLYASVLVVLLVTGFIAGLMNKGLSQSLLAITQQQMTSLVWKVVILLIVMALLLLLCWAASRAIIWSLVAGHHGTLKLVAQFALLYIVWLAIWSIPIYFSWKYVYDLVRMNITPGLGFFVLQYALLALFLYFTYAVCYELAVNRKVFSSLRKGVALSIRESQHLLGPFLLMVATIIVVGLLSKLAEFFPKTFSAIVGSILFFATFAWAKVYYAAVLKRVIHQEQHSSHHHS